MIKRMIIVLGALAIVFGAIFGWKAYKADQMEKARAAGGVPAVVISSTDVIEEQWERRISSVGSLSAIQGVEVSSEVPGKVVRINFESGERIDAGAILVQLDATQEQAELRSLEAELDLARLDHERAERLVKRGAVSQAQLDRATSEMNGLVAKVEEQKALIAKKTIRAPFAGELGIRMVNIGQFLSPGTEIVTLQRLDPIYANFTLPERFLNQLSVGQTLEAEVAAFPDDIFPGKVTAISPRVEETTRNVRLQATLENPDRRLRPGMFARIQVVSGGAEPVLTLPETAITFYPYGDSVFTIVKDPESDRLIAERRQVATGRKKAGRIEIVSGLSKGDTVVNTGQLKLQSGQFVKIDNSIELTGDVSGR